MKSPSEKQIQIMRLALGLSGLPCHDSTAEKVILVVDAMEKLGNSFSVKDASSIEWHILNKYNKKKVSAEQVEKNKQKPKRKK